MQHWLYYIIGKNTVQSRDGKDVVQQIRNEAPWDAYSLYYIPHLGVLSSSMSFRLAGSSNQLCMDKSKPKKQCV